MAAVVEFGRPVYGLRILEECARTLVSLDSAGSNHLDSSDDGFTRSAQPLPTANGRARVRTGQNVHVRGAQQLTWARQVFAHSFSLRAWRRAVDIGSVGLGKDSRHCVC
jgi:hypothetical protein